MRLLHYVITSLRPNNDFSLQPFRELFILPYPVGLVFGSVLALSAHNLLAFFNSRISFWALGIGSINQRKSYPYWPRILQRFPHYFGFRAPSSLDTKCLRYRKCHSGFSKLEYSFRPHSVVVTVLTAYPHRHIYYHTHVWWSNLKASERCRLE